MSNALNVSRALQNPGQLYPFSMELSVEEAQVFGETVRFAQAQLEGTFLGAEKTVTVRGELRAEATMACARCLQSVRVPLCARIDERFSRERDPNDPDVYVFEGSALDLDACAREALLLQLPMRVLCSEECKGLCPVCGANRNQVSCACLEGEVISPFSALKAMVQNDEEV